MKSCNCMEVLNKRLEAVKERLAAGATDDHTRGQYTALAELRRLLQNMEQRQEPTGG